jgi:hypothetical protein
MNTDRMTKAAPDELSVSGTLFQRVLGAAWHTLPKPVQALHSVDRQATFSGLARIERGAGWLARLIAGTIRFPAAGHDVPVTVSVKPHARGESWNRTFSGRSLPSEVSRGAGRSAHLLHERFGPFTCHIALVPEGGKLRFMVKGWNLGALPLPRRWAPGGDSYEFADGERFGFHIEVRHPLAGLIVSYVGWLDVQQPSTATISPCPSIPVSTKPNPA